jgi:uncharacterized RDD family membrane protein YckC
MRSAIQANRGQASILQGLPAETPETPVLISKIYSFFSFSFRVHLFWHPVLFTMSYADPFILYRTISGIRPGIQNAKTRVISNLVQVASVRFRHSS